MGNAPVQFRDADENEVALFAEILEEYHEPLSFYELRLLFRDKPSVAGGWKAAATAHKASRPVEHLAGIDGWIEVWEDAWDRDGDDWKRFLLDHELQHFAEEGGKLVLVGHPFEDFPDVLARHSPDITGLRKLMEDHD